MLGTTKKIATIEFATPLESCGGKGIKEFERKKMKGLLKHLLLLLSSSMCPWEWSMDGRSVTTPMEAKVSAGIDGLKNSERCGKKLSAVKWSCILIGTHGFRKQELTRYSPLKRYRDAMKV